MTSKPRRIAPRSVVLLALFGLVFLAAGATTWFLRPPPEIMARMLLHVDPTPPRILFKENEETAAQYEAFLRKQEFLIRDRLVLNAALNEPGVANLSLIREKDDPVQWLETAIQVDFPNPEFMRIALSGDRPQEQIKIVNAVTKAYFDNVVNVEKNEWRQHQERLEKTKAELENKLKRKQYELRRMQLEAGGFNEESLILSQEIAQEELQAVKKQLIEVRNQLLLLSVEVELHPNWQEKVWPQYAAGLLSLQLGHGLPVNHALVGLLHESAQLVPQAARRIRQEHVTRDTKNRNLKALEGKLLEVATRLSEQAKKKAQDGLGMVQAMEEYEAAKKLVQRANDKLMRMEVEQEAPSRITQPNKEATLSTPVPTKRRIMATAAATLAGLGIVLLALAGFRFRAAPTHDTTEQPPPLSSPE